MASSKPEMPGIERLVSAAPTDDTARERAVDPGAMLSAGRSWTPFGLTLLGHQISINPATGGLAVSVIDADVAYQALPLRVLRTYDAQEQYAQARWIEGHPDTDPRFHLFANWQMNREVLVSEAWRRTCPEILVADGAGDSGLFYRDWPDFSVNTTSATVVEERLRAYGVPGRTMQAMGWAHADGDVLLKTRQGSLQLLVGAFRAETMTDRSFVRLCRFDPVRGLAARYSSEFAYDQWTDEHGDREVTVPALVTRVIDSVGHTLDFAPAESAPPYRNYLLRSGAGQTMRLEVAPLPVYRDGFDPTRFVRVAFVARLVDLSRDDNNTTTYTYEAGRLVAVAYPARLGGDGPRVFRYEYDDLGLLRRIVDPVGDSVRFEYHEDLVDIDDRLTERVKLTRVVDDDGNEMRYVYDHAAGEVTVTSRGPAGDVRSVRYRYLEDVVDTDQRYVTSESIDVTLGYSGAQTITSRWEYTSDGRFLLERSTDPVGAVSRAEYNQHNQIIATTDPTGQRRAFEYDISFAPTAATPNRYDLVRVSETNVGVDGAEFLVESTFEMERYSAVTSSDAADIEQSTHRSIARVDPNGHRWQYGYDDVSNSFALAPTSTIDPLGNVSTRRFDDVGNQIEETDATGVSRRWAYDARGALVANEDGNGNRRTWLRDPGTSWVIAATDAFGSYPGDPAHSLQYQWNDAGQMLSEVDAVGDRTEYEYNRSKRLRLVRRFDPTPREIAFEYDATGALTGLIDPLGRRTVLRYDEAGRLYDALRDTGVSPSLRFQMDPAGRVVGYVDRNGQVTSMTYDPLGRLTKLDEPAWPLATLANPGKHVEYTYDRAGRRLRIVDSEMPSACEYVYDRAGNLLQRAAPYQGTLAWKYDDRNALSRVSGATGSIDLAFDRDPAGRTLAVTDSDVSGPSRRYRYQWRDGDLVDNLYGTDVEGLPMRRRQEYDDDRQLVLVTNSVDETTASEFGYAYRADGLLSATTGTHAGEYEYDGMKRLVRETDVGLRSGYDGVGNRLWRAPEPPAITGQSTFDDDNRLLSAPIEGTQYEYDANGARTRRTAGSEVHSYTYDGGGRLRSVDLGTQQLRYLYDVDGRLVERTLAGSQPTVERFAYANRSVLATLDENDAVLALYTRDDDGRLLRRRDIAAPQGTTADPNSLYYITDGRLHVMGLVAADGADRARFDYDAWGNSLLAEGTAADERFRYRSGFRDHATGLYQFGARWYDPQVGRWLTQDPLLQSLILARSDLLPRWAELSNLYSYASNNPGLQFDPTGFGPSLPKGWPQPPGWKGGFKWKWLNQPGGELVDPDGGRWHWHPEDAGHNEHWDYRDKRDKWRLDKDGKDLGDDAFKPQEDEDTVCEPGEQGEGSGAPISGGGSGSASDDDSGITKRILQGGGVVAAGYGLWTVGKWTVALLAAPETEGGSLVLAGITP